MILNSNDSGFTPTAAAHITRVTADAGVVTDSIRLHYAYELNKLLTSKLGRSPLWVNWCDVDFGVKYDVNKKISKVYDILNLNDHSEATLANRPTLVRYSNYNAIQFDGVNDRMNSTNDITWGTDKASVIYIRKLINNLDYNDRFIASTDVTTFDASIQWQLGNGISGDNALLSNTGLVINKYTTQTFNTEIHACTFDMGASSTSRIKFYKNNVEVTNTPNNVASSGNYTTNKLFIMNAPTLGVYTPGYIHAWLVLKEKLTYTLLKSITDFYNLKFQTY